MIKRRAPRAGFALLEALAALALSLMLFAGLSLVTSGWMQRWVGIAERGETADVAATVLDRMVEDLEAARFLVDLAQQRAPAEFTGEADAVVFVRPALGFEPRAGLEEIRYRVATETGIVTLVRERRDYFPGGGQGAFVPLPLMEARLSLAFRYIDHEGEAQARWFGRPRLPTRIEIELSVPGPHGTRRVAVARPRITWPIACVPEEQRQPCEERLR
jgi:general secretion pathway protein J